MDGNAVWTVVVAAGSGRRFGADKLNVVLLDDTTVLDLSVATAAARSDGVVVVLRADDPLLGASPAPGLRFVAGGATRSSSVRQGLAAVPDQADIVLVHDAARPLADGPLFDRVIGAVAAGAVAVVPAVPVVDTIRALDGTPVDRGALRAVQTPQGFSADVLRAAHAAGGEGTDDASLVEALGHAVVMVDGDDRNLKITRPADIAVVRALLHDADAQPSSVGGS